MAKGHPDQEVANGVTDTPDKYLPDKMRQKDGYGQKPPFFGLSSDGYERWAHRHLDETYHIPTHRLMAVAEYGLDALKGKVVHHKNGIRWDNRPENIELMTQAEHIRGHFESGQFGKSRLTEEDVAQLRSEYTGERTFEEIAKDYPVGAGNIRAAVRGDTWEWVDEPPVRDGMDRNPAAKLTEEDVIEIRERYEPYYTTREELAEEYGVSKTTISDVVNGESWQGVGE